MASLPPSTALPNVSSSWSQNRRSEQSIEPFAQIDLHGYTKEKAIRSLTNFWESSARTAKQTNPWVCVITGTGAHSGALGGPILKQSVQKLLVKRHMEYCYSKKKGFFLVNVHSGFVLKHNPTADELHVAAAASGGGDYSAAIADEPLGKCTKLKIMPREHVPGLYVPPPVLRPNHKKKVVGKKIRKDIQTHHSSSSAASASSPAAVRQGSSSPSPLPSELAADQQMIEKAKSQSLNETRQRQSHRDKEQHTLEQVLQKTQQEALEEEQREQELLQKAMELSQQETAAVVDHDEELERILRLSQQEAESQPLVAVTSGDDDEELQRILSQSNLEHLQQQQEEEAELERILRLSMTDVAQVPVTSSTTDLDEEEALQQVLRLSLVDTSGAIHDAFGAASMEQTLMEFSQNEDEDAIEQALIEEQMKLQSQSATENGNTLIDQPDISEQVNMPSQPVFIKGQNTSFGEKEPASLPLQSTFNSNQVLKEKSPTLSWDKDQILVSLPPIPSSTENKAILHETPTFQLDPLDQDEPTLWSGQPEKDDANLYSLFPQPGKNSITGAEFSTFPASSQSPVGQLPTSSAQLESSTENHSRNGGQYAQFLPLPGQPSRSPVGPTSLPPAALKSGFAGQPATLQNSAPPQISAGEALIESILYKNPTNGLEAPTQAGTPSVHFQPSSSKSPRSLAPNQEPDIPQGVMEHRMMELLQRPIGPPSLSSSIPACVQQVNGINIKNSSNSTENSQLIASPRHGFSSTLSATQIRSEGGEY